MTVTDIVELSKSRARIMIDDETAFVLYKSEIRNMDIKKGGEFSEESLRYIMDELLVKRAKLRCMNLLKRRDYTRHQLATKLRQGCYPDTVIEKAINDAASYGYIDDIRYAMAYIRYAGELKSKKQIENDLMKKGVSKQDIANAYLQCEEEHLVTDEDELIKKFLLKKNYNRNTSAFEERQKMIAFLYRKGFPLDRIYKAVGQCE